MLARGDGTEPLSRDRVGSLIRARCFPEAPDAEILGRVGVEVERFPIRLGADGTPAGRMPLEEVLDAVSGLGTPPLRCPAAVPAVELADGGRLMLEPGGQLEHATSPCSDVAEALAELHRWQRPVDEAFREARGVLASSGIDVWHNAADVRQQLSAPRYPAMASYLRTSGTGGHEMMCHTASVQINLDLGPPDVAKERWLVANLVAPLLTATFACSPVGSRASGRADVWRRTDPTRTGFPRLLLQDADSDPVAALVDAALSADVLVRWQPDGRAVPGVSGRRFVDWLDDDAADGRPTEADLAYHLTTLFHEVRLRGFLEIRSVDALPRRWWPVPVVLLTGVLYDDRARASVRGVMTPYHAQLPDLQGRAAATGVADPAMCALAVETWSFALAGARRLPDGWIPEPALQATERFLDRFTLRGRCPADELREQLGRSPAAALAWATEAMEIPTPA